MWLQWAINSNNNNYWATKRFHHYWCSASKAPILCKSLQLFVHTGGMENKSLPAVLQRGYMMAPAIKVPWTEQSTNLSTLSKQAFKTRFAWNKLPILLIQNNTSIEIWMRPATSIVVSLVRQRSTISKPIGLGLLQFKTSHQGSVNDVTLSMYQWSSFLCEWFWNPATAGETNEKQALIAGPRSPFLCAQLYLLCQFQCSTFTIIACNQRRCILILFSAARLVSP